MYLSTFETGQNVFSAKIQYSLSSSVFSCVKEFCNFSRKSPEQAISIQLIIFPSAPHNGEFSLWLMGYATIVLFIILSTSVMCLCPSKPPPTQELNFHHPTLSLRKIAEENLCRQRQSECDIFAREHIEE